MLSLALHRSTEFVLASNVMWLFEIFDKSKCRIVYIFEAIYCVCVLCVCVCVCSCVGLRRSSNMCPALPPLYVLLNCVLHMWFLALRLTRQEHSAPTLGDMIEKVLPGK